jgi:hypothetical protein
VTERAQLPHGPTVAATTIRDDDLLVLPQGQVVVRVHPLGGSHPRAWNELRQWGPTRARFDHHTLPSRDHPTRRVMYVSWGDEALICALAEAFQEGARAGAIDRGRERMNLTIFALAEDLPLLDLDGGWLTRAGGNRAVQTGPRGTARAWARAIYRHHPGVAGLAYRSSVWGPGRCLALWDRGALALPPSPAATAPLVDPALHAPLAAAAHTLGVPLL